MGRQATKFFNFLTNSHSKTNFFCSFPKWTFVRVLGVQEPASAVFSLLNLMTQLIAYRSYVGHVFQLSWPSHSRSSAHQRFWNVIHGRVDQLFVLHSINAFLSLNAWLWSIVYHVKDSKFSEVKTTKNKVLIDF